MANGVRGNMSGAAALVTGVRGTKSSLASIGVLQGINLGGPQSPYSSSTYQCLMTMVARDNVEGSPGPPCLALTGPTMFHFRWSLHTGQNVLTIQCKQVINAALS